MWGNGISFRYTPDLGAFDWLNHPGPLAIEKAEIWTSWKFSTVFLGEVTDRPLFPWVFSPYTILGSLKYHSKLTFMMPFYRGLGQVRVKTEERAHSLPPLECEWHFEIYQNLSGSITFPAGSETFLAHLGF